MPTDAEALCRDDDEKSDPAILFPAATWVKRFSWCGNVMGGVVGWFFMAVGAVGLAAPGANGLSVGKIEWTRLITHSEYWDRHAEADSRLLHLLATRTPLSVEPRMRATSPATLEELSRFPFIYAHDISPLSPAEARNLAEYVKRGGFLFVDFCGNVKINPAPTIFLARQVSALKPHVPDLRVEALERGHPVFSIFFKMAKFPPQTRPGDSRWLDGPTNPMRALYSGDRMIGIVGLSGFQCAWGNVGSAENAVECMQMVANIYIYAMTH